LTISAQLRLRLLAVGLLLVTGLRACDPSVRKILSERGGPLSAITSFNIESLMLSMLVVFGKVKLYDFKILMEW
jgi:hypothetical protein